MILGLSTATFTLVHVVISLIGIASGLVALYGLLSSRVLAGWTLIFIATTAATNLTGFFFPFNGITPAIAVGVLSSIILVVAAVARYPKRLAGAWRWLYVASAVITLYFNVFVLVAQAFLKIPSLHELAPKG